jgi:uncharacterized protein Veg
MIENIKKTIGSNIGSNVKVIVNNMRNKKEEYVGKIEKSYNHIFIIRIDEDMSKAFSYTDILVQNIEIFFE